MSNYEVEDVETYIAHAAAEARPILEELRTIIRSAVPDVEETISWGVPFYRRHGALGGYAAYKKHVSFGCDSDLQATDREALEEDGYKTGKKTVSIAFGQTVPAAAIRRMVEAQARMNEARGRSSAG
jgi:uncharacterized protein YdhG (YjbR/CyaY superfamily)